MMPAPLSRRLFISLILASSIALLAAAPAGAAPGPQILSPKDGRFFTRAPVTVTVKTADSGPLAGRQA
jgi:hypothetical protein